VLQALSLPEEIVDGSLRIGLGKFTTEEELSAAAEILTEAVIDVQQFIQ